MSKLWERKTISNLRERFSDLVHSVNRLDFSMDDVTVKFLIGEGKGVFRVHPRLPAIQLWPTRENGENYLKRLSESNNHFREDVSNVSKVKAAREAILKARKRGMPPKASDMRVAGRVSSRIRRGASALQDRSMMEIKLDEISKSVEDAKLRRRSSQRNPMVVPLRLGVPSKLAKSLPVRLVINFSG